MSYRIELATQPKKYLEKLDRAARDRFAVRLEDLKKDPFGISKPLVNHDARSCRVGDWRIIFRVELNEVLLVVKIQPRGDVYKNI